MVLMLGPSRHAGVSGFCNLPPMAHCTTALRLWSHKSLLCASHSQTLPAAYGIKSDSLTQHSCPLLQPHLAPHPHFYFMSWFSPPCLCLFCSLRLDFPVFLLCCAHLPLSFRKAASSAHIASRKTLTSQAGLRAPPCTPHISWPCLIYQNRPDFPSLTSKKRYCGALQWLRIHNLILWVSPVPDSV